MNKNFSLVWSTVAINRPRAAIFNETIDGDDYSLILIIPSTPSNKQSQNPIMRNIRIETGDSSTKGLPLLDTFPSDISDLSSENPVLITSRKDYEMETLFIKGEYQSKLWEQSLRGSSPL